jgi:Periplasmic copper-binding protein (NosD)
VCKFRKKEKNMKNTIKLMMAIALVIASSQLVFAQDEKATEISSSQSTNRGVTISRSGYYRLGDDINVASGNAVTITASNVTLDLGGNTISTNAAGTGSGIFVNGASGVEVRNGKVGGFNANVNITSGVNVRIRNLQIVGRGLAPNNGPTEIGVLLIQTRGAYIENNTISSVNLGIFVRGGNSTGNRIFENVVVGGANPANNLLGICYNPAAGAGTAGPRGDNIYNNHITRFGFAIAISAESISNIFNENVLASFTAGIREPGTLTTGGGTNISEGNLMTTIPATVLP